MTTRHLTTVTLAGAVLLGAAVGAVTAPPAAAAPTDSATETIADLQRQGYTVNIDRVGSGGLADCLVTSVRNPKTISSTYRRPDRADGRRGRLVTVVVSRTIQVSLNCGT